MTYLDMDLSHKRSIQEQFVLYNQSLLGQDPKLDELIAGRQTGYACLLDTL